MLVFASLWGSPGVTTVAYQVASALVGSQGNFALLAECDPSGGDLAVRLAMPVAPGMATLMAAARRGLVVDDIWEHVQESPHRVGMLFGLDCAEHSAGAGGMWETCARALARVDELQVLVDVGRLEPGMAGSRAFLESAGSVVLCARPDASSLVHTARRIDTLRAVTPDVRLVLIGEGPYGPREATEATGIEVVRSMGREPSDRDWVELASGLAESSCRSAPPAAKDIVSSHTPPAEECFSVDSPRERDGLGAIAGVSIHEVRARMGLRVGSGSR